MRSRYFSLFDDYGDYCTYLEFLYDPLFGFVFLIHNVIR